MITVYQKVGSYLWGFSAVALAIGFIAHPARTTATMQEPAWWLVHALILCALFALVFALGLITYEKSSHLNALGWTGFVVLNLSAFLFMGVVFFDTFLTPTLAREAASVFADGIRIGPMKVVLPVTSLMFILGHVLYGSSMIRSKALPFASVTALIVFSVPVGLKPQLPEIVGIIGAIGYGLSAIAFVLEYGKAARRTSGSSRVQPAGERVGVA